MIICCIKCGKEFEQGDHYRQRKCKNSCYVKRKPKHMSTVRFWDYRSQIRRYWQDPVYQAIRLIHDEWIGSNTDKRILLTEYYEE